MGYALELRLSYYGWSSFRIDGLPEGPLILDPAWSVLISESFGLKKDFDGATGMLISHGHHEHLRDSSRLATSSAIPIAGPPQCMDYLRFHKGIEAKRVTRLKPDLEQRLFGRDDVSVVPRSFPHLEKNDVPGKLRILRRQNPVGAAAWIARYGLRFARTWWSIRNQPEGPPFFAYDLRLPGGIRLFFTVEAFTELLDPKVVETWAKGPAITLAIVGVESGQEGAAARLTAALGARKVMQIEHHAIFDAFYGRPPVCSDKYATAVRTLDENRLVSTFPPRTSIQLRPSGDYSPGVGAEAT